MFRSLFVCFIEEIISRYALWNIQSRIISLQVSVGLLYVEFACNKRDDRNKISFAIAMARMHFSFVIFRNFVFANVARSFEISEKQQHFRTSISTRRSAKCILFRGQQRALVCWCNIFVHACTCTFAQFACFGKFRVICPH